MSKVFQFKCIQVRKNVRKVGWVGRDDADINHMFQITNITTSSKHQQMKREKKLPNG